MLLLAVIFIFSIVKAHEIDCFITRIIYIMNEVILLFEILCRSIKIHTGMGAIF